MNEKIDLNDMRLFVAVVRAGSLSKASELLGVSKSRLSRRLTGLENALGTTLLDRGRRGILLNELGTQFFQQTEAMLQCAEQAVAGVRRGLDEPRAVAHFHFYRDSARCACTASRRLFAPLSCGKYGSADAKCAGQHDSNRD